VRHTGAADEPGAIDDGHWFVRWVEDPEGELYRVQMARTLGVSGPVFLDASGGGRLVRGFVRLVNKGLVRVQHPRDAAGASLEVSRVDSAREETVLDEWDWDDDWEAGRRRAEDVVRQIRAGTFVPPEQNHR
jgi:hypothetical protein